MEETKEKEGIIALFTADNWEQLGLTPIILFGLIKRGWSSEELIVALTELIGPDFNQIKMHVWLERLEEKGIDFSRLEPMPLIELIDRILFIQLRALPTEVSNC